ncbi:MAG: NAD(P)-binding domain-containing protein, partial [Planctomycetes bacterium]|nr:NAD(P)-binding domain-containing protein [Planctomycetota bacterium]
MKRRAKTPRSGGRTPSSPHDLVLIGAGPCGLAAAAEFRRAGLRYVHLEAGELAQTVRNFARKVRLFSTRDRLEIGGVPFGPDPRESPTREEFLAYLRQVTRTLGLRVRLNTRVVRIRSRAGLHVVEATRAGRSIVSVPARNVVVASGGYYAPRRLGIPGEDAPNVSHYVRDFGGHRGKRVLVVGGRNSAVEAAAAFAQRGARVTLAYRGARIPRKMIKPWLLPPFDAARAEGRIAVFLQSPRINCLAAREGPFPPIPASLGAPHRS